MDFTSIAQEETGRSQNEANWLEVASHLSPPVGSIPIQGYLLKRSDTLRLWNQRWFTLDPKTAKIEYRTHHNDPSPRGVIYFDPESTITVSPINFHGGKQYEGCCFYIGSSRRNQDYFLCANSPSAAKAWVSAIRAAAGVLKAHEEAVRAISEPSLNPKASKPPNTPNTPNSGGVQGALSVAARVAVEASQQLNPNLGSRVQGQQLGNGGKKVEFEEMMRETLRVKDEEIGQLAARLRATEASVSALSQHLAEVAAAAESAAESARKIEGIRRREEEENLRRVQGLRGEVQRERARAELAEARLAELLSLSQHGDHKEKPSSGDSVSLSQQDDTEAGATEARETGADVALSQQGPQEGEADVRSDGAEMALSQQGSEPAVAKGRETDADVVLSHQENGVELLSQQQGKVEPSVTAEPVLSQQSADLAAQKPEVEVVQEPVSQQKEAESALSQQSGDQEKSPTNSKSERDVEGNEQNEGKGGG